MLSYSAAMINIVPIYKILHSEIHFEYDYCNFDAATPKKCNLMIRIENKFKIGVSLNIRVSRLF